MIVPVDETNLLQAATIHSISWKESHRAFCTPDFIETHTPDRQREYLRNKMNNGTKLYMLVEEKSIGVVSVTKGLIEDLYILPDMQNMGYGTKLLLYAVGQCTDTPTLWILENNINAERLYRRIGFKETGRKNAITNRLDEIEFALTQIPAYRTDQPPLETKERISKLRAGTACILRRFALCQSKKANKKPTE